MQDAPLPLLLHPKADFFALLRCELPQRIHLHSASVWNDAEALLHAPLVPFQLRLRFLPSLLLLFRELRWPLLLPPQAPLLLLLPQLLSLLLQQQLTSPPLPQPRQLLLPPLLQSPQPQLQLFPSLPAQLPQPSPFGLLSFHLVIRLWNWLFHSFHRYTRW